MGIQTRNVLFIILLLISSSFVYSQNIDSLKQSLSTPLHDTTRVNTLIDLSEILYSSNPDTLIPLCKQALSIIEIKLPGAGKLEKKNFLRSKADALNNMGFYYKNQGKIPKALDYYNRSLKVREDNNDQEGIANSLINIGAIYYSQGNISEALDYFIRCLKIQEEIKNKAGIAFALNNMGLLYDAMSNRPKALDCLTKSLKIRQELNDKNGIAASLNNIGTVYEKQGDLTKALDNYTKGLKIHEETGNKRGIATSLSNLGLLNYKQNNTHTALDYYNQSLKIYEEINDNNNISICLANITEALFKIGQTSQALEHAERSLKIAQELKFPLNISKTSLILSKIYAQNSSWKAAYQMQVLYKQMSDSINNESNRKASVQKGFKYEYEKKVAADSVRAEEEHKVFEAQRKQEQTKRNALYIGIVLITLFSFFMYKRYRVTNSQKKIIEHQKKLVEEQKLILEQQKRLLEEHSKEISDSINYAERIQRSLLASSDLLSSNLHEHFIFFQPKAVVSGDFYWAEKLPDDKFLLVTADSTGHGVPGAIMSMLNISCLKETLKDGFTQPSEILNNTRKLIIETLKKDGSANGGKDGMDCSIICFDLKNNKLTYAAANNPVWIIRGKELYELPFDKMPVGKHERDELSFTQHEIELQPGDMVYTMTDGMPDQFGGNRGKKFMTKQLKELLVSHAHLSIAEQKANLTSALNAWKGNLEQVDDITLIGIRI